MSRRAAQFLALVVILAGAGWFYWHRPAATPAGGRLVVTQRTEPPSFNRLVVPQYGTELLSRLTNATLIRVDRSTGAIEPALAREWSTSPDGATFTMTLTDAAFSDGTPFTAADVVFTFRALYDPKVASPIATGMTIDGRPISVRALDDHHITVTFPAPFGPGLTLLDALPILPKHKLEAALDAGTFVSAWGAGAPFSDFAGLGPFVLAARAPGQSVTLVRNAHYWKKDAAGRALPYLNEVEIDFVPEQDAEMLRLESGAADLVTEQIRPEDVQALERAQHDGRVRLVNAGVSVDPVGLWFNLRPDAPAAKTKPWLQKLEFRRAVSMAVDRQKIVDTVFLGAAEAIYSPVTRGFGQWYAPELPHPAFDPTAAKALLDGLNLKDRNGDGTREDPTGAPLAFSVLTRKGNTALERTVANVQEQLAAVGIKLDIVTLETNALIQQYGDGTFETIYYGAPISSTDPSNNLDFWLSSGNFHFWHPNQTTPAAPWEQQMDAAMKTVSTSVDPLQRIAAFKTVQQIFIDQSPIVYFAAPTATVAMSARVTGASPVVLQPQVLWKPELLAVNGSGGAGRP